MTEEGRSLPGCAIHPIIGLINSADNPWIFKGFANSPTMKALCFCAVKPAEFHVVLTPTMPDDAIRVILESRRVDDHHFTNFLVGQCPRCMKIYWMECT